MKILQTLLAGLPCNIDGAAGVEITDVVIDSRRVKPGALFVALRGVHADGHKFVQAAIDAGARAVLAEEPLRASGATLVRVPNALQALSHVSVRFWDYPS